METSAPQTTAKQRPTPPLLMGQSFIEGRIANRRRMNSSDGHYWLSVIKIPSRDQFSHPGTIEITSQRPLGEVGDDWKGIIEVTGYPRSFNSKPDMETGEIKKISTADNRLRVVEE